MLVGVCVKVGVAVGVGVSVAVRRISWSMYQRCPALPDGTCCQRICVSGVGGTAFVFTQAFAVRSQPISIEADPLPGIVAHVA